MIPKPTGIGDTFYVRCPEHSFECIGSREYVAQAIAEHESELHCAEDDCTNPVEPDQWRCDECNAAWLSEREDDSHMVMEREMEALG